MDAELGNLSVTTYLLLKDSELASEEFRRGSMGCV